MYLEKQNTEYWRLLLKKSHQSGLCHTDEMASWSFEKRTQGENSYLKAWAKGWYGGIYVTLSSFGYFTPQLLSASTKPGIWQQEKKWIFVSPIKPVSIKLMINIPRECIFSIAGMISGVWVEVSCV